MQSELTMDQVRVYIEGNRICHSERPLRLRSGQAPGVKNLDFSHGIKEILRRYRCSE
jgi:hypothetical protein